MVEGFKKQLSKGSINHFTPVAMATYCTHDNVCALDIEKEIQLCISECFFKSSSKTGECSKHTVCGRTISIFNFFILFSGQ